MNELIELFKVLSDETRLRIINLIYRKNLCVCELVDILKLSQPKISKHIARLRSINLVNTSRNEQYIYYSINKDKDEYMNILERVFQVRNETLSNDISELNKIETFVCNK